VATLLPTNYVTRNDVADNDRPVAAGIGPVAVWTVDGDGNYWGSAPGLDRDGDAVLDRAYTPSDRVAVASGRAAGGPSLARAPALALLRRIEAQIPGLRQGDVVDRRPLRDPVRPAVLNEVRNETR
jgi:nitrous oxidase accessory protein NosD